jgi:uncharacterized RDD family membrane protein YckC
VNTERIPPPPHRAAGIVTRLLAASIDVVAVLLMMVGLYLGLTGLRFLWSPEAFRWPSPSLLHSIVLASVLAFCYFAIAWATTGRTYGAAVLGLRVLSMEHRVLGWVRAGLRAVACVVFPAGLLWVAVSRHRRSVQDVIVRSVVVYDWYRHGEAGARNGAEGRAPTPEEQREPLGRDIPDREIGAPRPPEWVEARRHRTVDDDHRENAARQARAEQPPGADVGTDGGSPGSAPGPRPHPTVNGQVRECE